MRDAASALVEELSYLSNGKIMRQARQILERAHRLLKRASETSLFDTIEAGQFLGVSRAKDQGRGLDGVFEKGRNYFNPFADASATARLR
jgi:beta-lysine 5,6-aminomutase alpha subunit